MNKCISTFLNFEINVRNNRSGRKEWTIQRHWLHWTCKKQDEEKQNTHKNKTQKSKKMSNTDSTKTG